MHRYEQVDHPSNKAVTLTFRTNGGRDRGEVTGPTKITVQVARNGRIEQIRGTAPGRVEDRAVLPASTVPMRSCSSAPIRGARRLCSMRASVSAGGRRAMSRSG